MGMWTNTNLCPLGRWCRGSRPLPAWSPGSGPGISKLGMGRGRGAEQTLWLVPVFLCSGPLSGGACARTEERAA